MRFNYRTVASIAASFLFVLSSACTNNPDQPAGFGDLPPSPEIRTPGTDQNKSTNIDFVKDYEEPTQEEEVDFKYTEGSPEADAVAKANSEKPITYDVGAAGITLDTTFDESKSILTKPLRGPDQDGQARYNEQIIVRWRTEGEAKTPLFILALPSYKGRIEIAKEAGDIVRPIALTQEFSSYMGGDPRLGADNLAADMYSAMTGSDTNCIKDKVCDIDWGKDNQDFFLVIYPGMIARFSKDRFSLFIILIQKTIPQGPLGNDFDLTTGQWIIENSDNIELGQNFETVNGKLLKADETLSEVPISPSTKFFSRNYTGIGLLYGRTNFDRNAFRPEPTDRLVGAQLYDQYRNFFLVNGAPVYVVERPGSVSLSQTPGTDLVDARSIELQTKLDLRRENVKPFARKLVKYLTDRFKKNYSMVSGYLSGNHQIKTIKQYDGTVVAFNPDERSGVYISFSASEETGNMDSVLVFNIDDSFEPYNQLVLPFSTEDRPLAKIEMNIPGQPQPVKLPFYTELSGVRLNDLVVVSEKDIRARGEATIQFVQQSEFLATDLTIFNFLPQAIQNTLGKKERAGYSDLGELFIPGFNDTLVPRKQHFASVSSFGVSMGLLPMQEVNGVTYARVVSITSGFVNGEIKDLCGLKTFNPKFRMKDNQFLSQLRTAIANEKSDCHYFFTYDSNSNQRVASVYFPKDRIRLAFGDRELAQAMIYLPLNAAAPVNLGAGE